MQDLEQTPTVARNHFRVRNLQAIPRWRFHRQGPTKRAHLQVLGQAGRTLWWKLRPLEFPTAGKGPMALLAALHTGFTAFVMK